MSSKLDRLVQMDALIRDGSYPSIATLGSHFEMSRRTITADLSFLRERLGAPLAHSRVNGGYYYTDPTWTVPSFLATEGDLLAFFLVAELSHRYLGTAFEAPLRKTIDVLARSLPDDITVDLNELRQHYTFTAGATVPADPALLIDLTDSIRERWRISMTYYTKSRGEENQRVIEPHHLYQVRGDWQVIAFDHLRQQFRNFAVDSIHAWNVDTTARFTRRPDFSATDYLSQGFLSEHGDHVETVVIWFDEYQARYMRQRTWHPTQHITEHQDGSLTLTFTTGALNEVARWVLSYGKHARVEQPPSLRANVLTALRTTLAAYEDAEDMV